MSRVACGCHHSPPPPPPHHIYSIQRDTWVISPPRPSSLLIATAAKSSSWLSASLSSPSFNCLCITLPIIFPPSGAGGISQYSHKAVGWMIGVRFPDGAVKGLPSLRYRVHTGCGANPTSYQMDTLGGKAAGAWSWLLLCLMPRLRMRGAVPPPYFLMASYSLSMGKLYLVHLPLAFFYRIFHRLYIIVFPSFAMLFCSFIPCFWYSLHECHIFFYFPVFTFASHFIHSSLSIRSAHL